MGKSDMKPGFRISTISATLAMVGLLVSCTAPEEKKPLSPVADPSAPMRVSTARVSTAAPDPVGRLFNDGPRQVVTYSVNTDPLSVLFRDPAFIVNLSQPIDAQRIQVSTAVEPAQAINPSDKPVTEPPNGMNRSATNDMIAESTQPMTIDQPTKDESASRTAASVITVGVTNAPQPEASSAVSTSTDATAVATVATVAAIASTPSTQNDRSIATPPVSSEPIVLDGLKQKSAGWPVAVKPANVFGTKSPDGNAWRGLIYKSPAKTPVKAIDPGKVVFAQPLRGYGNVIIVDHGKQYTSIYGYNDTLIKNVGDIVSKGETVALVGDSGPLADEALYFEIRKGSVPIDPSIYLTTNP